LFITRPKTMFESNYLANDRGRFVRNNTFRLFLLGVPSGGLLAFLMYLGNQNRRNAQVFILVVIVPYTVLMTLYLIYVAVLWIKRWNRTIHKINIESGNLSIETFAIFWYKPIIYAVKVSDVIIKKSAFVWYGKEKKEGLVIKVGREELYFVKDYFDKPESILNFLSSA
jgi:hypothetical protein